MLLGLTGLLGSGKDLVASYLVTTGFEHVSAGDLVRHYVVSNRLGSLERPNLQRQGTLLRQRLGSGYLVERSLMNARGPLVISGIRAIGEVSSLRRHEGLLVAVDALARIRYQRLMERGRAGDQVSPEDFVKQELQDDAGASTDHDLTVPAVIRLADYTILNNGSVSDLKIAIESMLARLGYRGS